MRRRLIAGLLAAVLVMMSGCSGNTGKDASEEDETGGYIQEYVSMPENVSYCYEFARLADGTIRLVAGNGIYDTVDGGKTWTAFDYGSALLAELFSGEETSDEEEEYYSYMYPECVSIHSDGTLFTSIDKWEYNAEGFGNEVINLVIAPDGTETILDIDLPELSDDYFDGMAEETVISAADDETAEAEDEQEDYQEFEYERSLSEAVFAGNDTIVGSSNGTDELFVIDLITGEIRQTLKSSDDYIEAYAVYNGQIIVKGWESLEVFDLETGELTAGMPALEAYFNDERFTNFMFMPDESGQAFYVFENDKGIYKFTEAQSEPQLLVAAANNAMANPDIYFENFLLLEDESFLAMVDKDGGEDELICFSYVEELPEPELTLTIYSLTQNSSVKRSVANFQERYPQYEVNYVYGIDDWDSGLSLADVLKNLNTEILGGNGPDIIMMDGISLESYVETGVLADISDIITAAEGEYFDNVLNTYATDEGTYAVPTRFVMPVMLGSAEDLAQLEDFSSLAGFVAEKRQADSDDELKYVMGRFWASELASYALQIAGNDMIKEDGTVDEAKLKQYISDVKTMYENNELAEPESHAEEDDGLEDFEEEELDSDFYYEYDEYIEVVNEGIAYLESGRNLLLTGNVMNMEGVLELITMQDKFELQVQTMGIGDEVSYMPMKTFAVNAQSEHVDAAGEFIAFLISPEAQAATEWETGLPVSMSAYDTLYQKELKEAASEREGYSSFGYGFGLDDGSEYEIMFEMDGVTAEDYEQVKELLQKADTPTVNNNIIVTTILRQMSKCLDGQISEAEAADNILADINLYLAE